MPESSAVAVIRIRRVRSTVPFLRRYESIIPFLRRYEVDLAPHGSAKPSAHTLTGNPLAVLEPLLGVGDAWSFIKEADRQWAAGNRDWAVSYEQPR